MLNEQENIGRGKESVAEYMIKIAGSLAKYLLENRISLEILAHAGKTFYLAPNIGLQYFDEVMRFLASARPESRITLSEFAAQVTERLVSESTLIVICTDKTIDQITSFMHLSGQNVSIIPIVLLSFSFAEASFDSEKSMYLERVRGSGLSVGGLSPFFVAKNDSLEDIFSV